MGYALLRFCLGKYKHALHSSMNMLPTCMMLMNAVEQVGLAVQLYTSRHVHMLQCFIK